MSAVRNSRWHLIPRLVLHLWHCSGITSSTGMLPSHLDVCCTTPRSAALTPRRALHSHIDMCCTHTSTSAALTPRRLLHSHLAVRVFFTGDTLALVTVDGGKTFVRSQHEVPQPPAPRVDALPIAVGAPGLPVRGAFTLHDFGAVGGGTGVVSSKTSNVWMLGACSRTSLL
jgi:hypothetical protein